MKKFNTFITLMLVLLMSAGIAFANGVEHDPAGYYVRYKTDGGLQTQYFLNGQPNNSSEWEYCGATTSSCNTIIPPNPPLNTSNQISTAGPSFFDGSSNEGYIVSSNGAITVHSFGQGTLFADATAVAFGNAFGIGGQYINQTSEAGFGISGALSGVCLGGVGAAIGIDKLSLSKNPDMTFVDIKYEGYAEQWNHVIVGNGDSGAGGWNQTGTKFEGSSFTSSDGTGYVSLGRFGFTTDIGFPAGSADCAGGCGLAGGFTVANFTQTPTSATANALTAGFSGFNADKGNVWGNGEVGHLAQVPGVGVSQGQSTFAYSGNGSLGIGYAQTGGAVNVINGTNSQSVVSVAHGSAGSFVGGSLLSIKAPN